MPYSNFRNVLGACFLCLVFYASPLSGQTNTGPQKSAAEIIGNKALWGKDFPLVIAHLESLSKAGEKRIEVSPVALTTTQRYVDATAAQDIVKKLNKEVGNADRQDLFKKTKKNFPFTARTIKAETVKMSGDSLAVSLNAGETELLKPGVRMTDVQREIGAPERVGYRTVNARGEELPQITTYYSYANGSIVFAESNYSSDPRKVTKVYLDVPKLTNELKISLK